MRDPKTPDCAIKGCNRAADKSGLCAAHHKLVPFELSLSLSAEIMVASSKLAARRHREWQKLVQASLDSGTAIPRRTFERHPNHAIGMRAAVSRRA